MFVNFGFVLFSSHPTDSLPLSSIVRNARRFKTNYLSFIPNEKPMEGRFLSRMFLALMDV